jgi:hypothetical protein
MKRLPQYIKGLLTKPIFFVPVLLVLLAACLDGSPLSIHKMMDRDHVPHLENAAELDESINGNEHLSEFDLARTLFLAGQTVRSQLLFQSAWNQKVEQGPPRHCIAFYLGLIAETLDKNQDANAWYLRAQSMVKGKDAEAFYAMYGQSFAKRNPSLAQPGLQFVVFGAQQVEPNHDESREAYDKLIKTAQTAFDGSGSTVNKINLATALLLHAELVSRPDETLFTTANNHFEKGMELYEEIQDAIANDPELNDKLVDNPLVAMRLDTVAVRLQAIEKKQEVSRKSEQDRLGNLRQIIEHYRESAGAVSTAMTYLALQEHSPADEAMADAETAFARIQMILEVNKDRDYYLLADEPDFDIDPDERFSFAPIEPFTEKYESQLNALKATVRFRSAVDGGEDPVVAILQEVIADAKASIDETMGGDVNNPLAYYVHGLAEEELGLLLTRNDKANRTAHTDATNHFDKAIEQFNEAKTRLQQPADERTESLHVDLDKRINELNSPAGFIERSLKSTREGNTDAAFAELQEGLFRHVDADIWYAWGEAGMRGKEPESALLDGLKAARDSGILPEDNYRTILIPSKIVLSEVLRKMAERPLANIQGAEKTALVERLLQQSSSLEEAAEAAGNLNERSQCQAFSALAVSLRVMLQASEVPEVERVKTYHLAENAHFILIRNLDLLPQNVDDFGLREAIIASRLAQGYLAVKILQPYQDDAITAFSTALDELSRLPFRRPDAKVLGTPLLIALRNRPNDADEKVLAEERTLRTALESIVDGTVALYYGNAAKAVREMEDALEDFVEPGAGTDNAPVRVLDAAQLLAQSDGVRMLFAEDQLRSFHVMALIEADRADEAIVEAIRLVLPDELKADTNEAAAAQIDLGLIRRAIAESSSPMAAHALSRALEEYVVSKGLGDFPERKAYLEQTKASLKSAGSFLSVALRDMYPVLAQQNDDAIVRLNIPESYVRKGNNLRGQNRLLEAEELLTDGVIRHPENVDLWRQLIQVALDRADTEIPPSDDRYENSLQLIDRMQLVAGGMLYWESYYRGYVHEHTGNFVAAERAYRLAEANAENDKDRLRAAARRAITQLNTLGAVEQ